jgi:hypothetical protein
LGIILRDFLVDIYQGSSSFWTSATFSQEGEIAQEELSTEKGVASADLREAMQNAGVVDKPDVYFLG